MDYDMPRRPRPRPNKPVQGGSVPLVYPVEVSCPYCGESFSTVVDGWGGSQTCVEDCAVCCRPVLLTLDIDANGTLQALHIAREDD